LQTHRSTCLARARVGAELAYDGATNHIMDAADLPDNEPTRLPSLPDRQEERQRLAYIIEGTQAGTWEWNSRTDEIRFNAQWARLIGYTPEELGPVSRQTWRDRAHPQDLLRSDDILHRHLAGATPNYECEVRLRHRAGHWIWVLSRGRVQTWTADQQPGWMYGVDIEVTRLKQQEEALRKSRSFLQRAGQVAGVGGWEIDLLSRTVAWSEETCRIHGVGPEFQPTLETVIQFYAPEDRAVIQAAVAAAIATGAGWDLELPLIRATGERIWVRTQGAVEREGGAPVRLVGALQDISAQRRLRAELIEQHELLRITLQSIGDAVITTDAEGLLVWLNPVAEELTGWAAQEARGRPLSQVFHTVSEETREPAPDPVASCLRLRHGIRRPHPTLLISREGNELGIEQSASPILSDDGKMRGVVLVFRDVTEQRRLSGEVAYRATHDALTDLVNRSEFETRLQRLLQKSREDHSEHTLLHIDIDQFKLVNDTCGHAAGDQLLQEIAKRFTEVIRARDTLARLGGDEFGIILEHCSADQAQRVAQQICDDLEHSRFRHVGQGVCIRASIGLVPLNERWASSAALLQAAETSCYAAKEGGRNRVHTWFDTDTAVRRHHGEIQWAMRIENALQENRFELHAQRIEALSRESPGLSVEGLRVEVLLRMVEANGAPVLPGAFLPAAERYHLASRIDRWVLRHALEWLNELSNVSKIQTLSINLSGQSVGDRAFHRHAIELLTAAGPGLCERLCFEITETATVTNLTEAARFIEQIRSLGVQMALDDFGAGASSFGYLKSLPVDYLKIDGQFIRDLIEDPLHEAAVRCFVDVAKIIGVKTVAEFVDRAEVLARLREIGIDFAQGFLLHRPEPLQHLLREPRPRGDLHTQLSE
jgi:diguanylate cyclase (GGDEF)-like protein/PAS domain S-box-containing protein